MLEAEGLTTEQMVAIFAWTTLAECTFAVLSGHGAAEAHRVARVATLAERIESAA